MNAVTYEERKATYKAALRKWGADAQTMMAIEEMSELTKEICKLGRGKRDFNSLADEIADVTIMLEQLRLIYDLNDAVCAHMDSKIRRLQERLGMVDVAIRPHKVGDGGILAMPMKKNVPIGHSDWELVTCPICGAECWESDLSRQAQKAEPGLRVACTECALRGGVAKGGVAK